MVENSTDGSRVDPEVQLSDPHEPLVELLVGIARADGYIPPSPIANINTNQIFGERGRLVAQEATVYIFKNMKTVGGDLLPKMFRCVFCTAFDDAYSWHSSLGSGGDWISRPFDGSETSHSEFEMPSVLPAVAMFMRRSDLPTKFHNQGMKWILDHEADLNASEIPLPSSVSLALWLTYNAGMMRGLRALRYWGELSEVFGPVPAQTDD